MSDLITVARPYAKAAFEAAQASDSVQQWSQALQFLTTLVSHEDMVKVLESPQLDAASKAGLMIEIAGDQLSQQQKNFINLLAENGRLSLINEIAELFEIFKAEAESTIEATVTSAFPLSDAQKLKITQSLKSKLGCDVSLVTETDASLIGGVVIRAGDLVIDGSAHAKLGSLAYALTH